MPESGEIDSVEQRDSPKESQLWILRGTKKLIRRSSSVASQQLNQDVHLSNVPNHQAKVSRSLETALLRTVHVSLWVTN
uniref:Uncharacterized protein n=1 Tax=Macrostomum lignano TaxID=282301 RepID=A0A1I8FJ35_9PLAT